MTALHRLHPDLRIYQTEQECGDGRNDWRYARYGWGLMKQFLHAGANAYAVLECVAVGWRSKVGGRRTLK